MKLLKKYFIIGFGFAGWFIVFCIILSAINHDGIICLDFNRYNEMTFEIILISSMIFIFVTLFIIELIKDLRG